MLNLSNHGPKDIRVEFSRSMALPSWLEVDIDVGESVLPRLTSGEGAYRYRVADRGYSGTGSAVIDQVEVGGTCVRGAL